MKRRTFIGLVASLALAPSVLLAGNSVNYTSGLIKSELAAGKTLFVDYAADWCGVCKRQGRIIDKLRAENPNYDKNVTFIRVDWDKFSSAPVSKERKIPRRSTLLVLKGDNELGRIVARTDEAQIKALLDKAL